MTLGNWEQAALEAQKGVDLGRVGGYPTLGVMYAALNRLDKAEEMFLQAEKHGDNGEQLLGMRYQVAFLESDTARMARLSNAALGLPGTEDLMLAMQADTEGWYGRLTAARELTRRAMDSAVRSGDPERAALEQAGAALREVEAGNHEQARADATAASCMLFKTLSAAVYGIEPT